MQGRSGKTPRQGRKGSRTPATVRDRIIALHREDRTASDIVDQLREEGLYQTTERTVRNIIARHAGRIADAPAAADRAWHFASRSMPAEDARLVLEVLAERVAYGIRSGGNVLPRPRYLLRSGPDNKGPSQRQAEWIVRIRRAAPGLPASTTLSLAHDYAMAEASTGDHDALGRLTNQLEQELVRLVAERMVEDDPT